MLESLSISTSNVHRRDDGGNALAQLAMRAGFHVFLIFNYGAFGVTASVLGMRPVLQLIYVLGGLFAAGLIASSPKARDLLGRCWQLQVVCLLALVSAAWSVDLLLSLKASFTLIATLLLGIALVGRLGSKESLRLFIRSMSLACLLSVVWGLAIPDWGTHQATDKYQAVHAGLWRGIFTHKVNLGIFAGLTTGLLLFYGWRVFSNPLSYMIALVSAGGCILGSGSASGLATFSLLTSLLFVSQWMAIKRATTRRPWLRLASISTLLIIAIIYSGFLDAFAIFLGKSSDMTGRTDYWPYVINYVNDTSPLLGFGYGQYTYVGEAIEFSSGVYLPEAHNGLIDMFVAFGYVGALLVAVIFVHLVWRSAYLLMRSPVIAAKLGVFPFSFFVTMLFVSYAESVVLDSRGVWTVLLSIAVCLNIRLLDLQRGGVQGEASSGPAHIDAGLGDSDVLFGEPPIQSRSAHPLSRS